MEGNQTWNYTSKHDLLVACVGYNFGDKPLERLPEIREARGAYGHQVSMRMGLTKDDIVLDIGSGWGFAARALAPNVRAIHCADISSDFLGMCAEELADFPNAHTHLMKHADFSGLKGLGINRAYATAVFIHFNIYDFYLYFEGLSDLMAPGSKLYFDYNEATAIDPALHTGKTFLQHVEGYRHDRSRIFELINPTNINTVAAMATLHGWHVVETWQTFETCHSVLMERR
jgi:predicted TPR repeat methyltransferase